MDVERRPDRRPAVGQEVRVVYDLEHPSRVRLADRSRGNSLGLLVLFLGWVVVSSRFILTAWTGRRPSRSGQLVFVALWLVAVGLWFLVTLFFG